VIITRSQPTHAAINVFGGRKKFGGLNLKIPAKIQTPNMCDNYCTTEHLYIYEIKLYFIFNGTIERFLNQGFKLNFE
jgi:type VI protein secretion system component Hcp